MYLYLCGRQYAFTTSEHVTQSLVTGYNVTSAEYFWKTNHKFFIHCVANNKKNPFSIAIENVKLVHECCPQHLGIGAARIKEDEETERVGKERRENINATK